MRQSITQKVEPRPPGVPISGVAAAFERAYSLLPAPPEALVKVEVWTHNGEQFVTAAADVPDEDLEGL